MTKQRFLQMQKVVKASEDTKDLHVSETVKAVEPPLPPVSRGSTRGTP